MRAGIPLLLLLLLVFSLSSASPAPAPIEFAEVTARAEVGFLHRSSATAQKYLIESMSGGAAAFDYDGDGKLDLFFVNGAKLSDPMPATGAKPDKSQEQYWNRL